MKMIKSFFLPIALFVVLTMQSFATPHFSTVEYVTPLLEIELINYDQRFKNSYYTVYLTNGYGVMRSIKLKRIFSILETGLVKDRFDGSRLTIESQTIPDYWYNEGLRPNYITVVFHKTPGHLLNTRPTRLSLETNFEATEVVEREIPSNASLEEVEIIKEHNQKLYVKDKPENRNYISRFTLPLVEKGDENKVHKIKIYPQI